ncbi:PREDICTED: skin secretory protein xP2-like [Elephantulus edwardii]|uniref:skin secretory protein xP2-like n=1 Tax=Elephantulus edwardii TaxID=28737 RepID=UPI0003F0C6AA|nr:PREDICTED: skin secretory protein xP2-like [Elephantulus edwardii]
MGLCAAAEGSVCYSFCFFTSSDALERWSLNHTYQQTLWVVSRLDEEEECLALARELNLQKHQIQVWFKNRRSKEKREWRKSKEEQTEPSTAANNPMVTYALADTTAPAPADGPASAYVHAPGVSTAPASADGPAPAYVHAPAVSTAHVPAPHHAPVPRPAPANVPAPGDPAFLGSAGFYTPAPSTSFGLWPRAQYANDYSQDQASGALAQGTRGNHWSPPACTQYPNPMGYLPDSIDSNFSGLFTDLQSPSCVSQPLEESVDLTNESRCFLDL